MLLMSSVDFFFSKLTLSKKKNQEKYQSQSNGLGPDQDRSVGPDLGSNR